MEVQRYCTSSELILLLRCLLRQLQVRAQAFQSPQHDSSCARPATLGNCRLSERTISSQLSNLSEPFSSHGQYVKSPGPRIASRFLASKLTNFLQSPRTRLSTTSRARRTATGMMPHLEHLQRTTVENSFGPPTTLDLKMDSQLTVVVLQH